jgi:putative membrane protein
VWKPGLWAGFKRGSGGLEAESSTVTWLHWVTVWSFDPGVWAGAVLLLLAYRWFPGARRDWRAMAWLGGVVVLFVALESAINVAGDEYLFSVHMAQHLILAMVGPPMLILGLPSATIDYLLQSRVGGLLRILVNPFLAGSAYFVVLVLWHWPGFYDYALTHSLALIFQRLTFVAVGVLFWWAVLIHRDGEPWNLGALGEVAYLTCGALPAVVVGLTIALIPHPIYTFYVHRSILLGISPLSDQRIGGLMMFIFDNLLMVGVAGFYFWRMFPSDGADEARLLERR